MMKPKSRELDRSVRSLYLTTLMLFALFFCSGNIYAQNAVSGNYATLKGAVVEKGNLNTPVEFATIQILPQGKITNTGLKGEFLFEKLSPGKIQVKIQFLGMESIDTTFTITAGKITEIAFKMQYSTFRLKDVTVVATESKAGQATASNISRQAMDHLQTSSLADIMQLLPGGVTINPSLSAAKTINIRNISSSGSDMNSLGTSIIVDGAPISNNANLQALSPTISGGAAAVGGGSSPSSGVDLRSLSTDNIESVEVIRGIPSAIYGDLTSGAVIIRSKAGREPLSVRFKTNPNIYQLSVGKGFSLGEKSGNLNVSGDYAYSVTNPTESYVYYQRASAKFLYSNVFDKLASNTSIDLSLGKDTREKNPDDMRTQAASGAKDLGIRMNTNGTWNINQGWLNTVQYTLSGSYTDKHSYSEELLGNAFAAYSMSTTNGAVLSNKPGQKVYDISGKELTNIPMSESLYYATYLPNEYFSRYDIYGKEVNFFANLKATFSKKIGNVSNRIVVGAEYKTDGNLGDGKVYDLKTPPYRSVSSENSSSRPRKYSDIPFVNQASIFLEENLLYTFANRDLSVQVGARYDNISGKNIISPRLNASLDILPNIFSIRGGYAILAKAPTSIYLNPENAYFDFVHYNTLNVSSVPVSEQLLLSSTKVFNTQNKDLKIATNNRAEVGFDFKIKKMRFSVTAFRDDQRNGYNLGSDFSTIKLVDYIQYKEGVKTAGSIPTLDVKSTNKVFISYSKPMNTMRAINRGIEYDFDLGRIDAIRTSFVVNGSYIRSTSWEDDYSFSSKKNLNSLEKNIGVYEKGKSKEEKERLTTTIRATHNIPSIGFVFTVTAEINWKNKYWTSYGNDTMFVSYISRVDGQVKPFDPSMKNDPEFSYMFDSKSQTRFIAESYFPTLIMNFNLSKEIGKVLRASFYANNMFRTRPLYQSKASPGSFTRLNIPMFFGFELALTIR